MSHQLDALREQRLFEKREKEAKRQRILKVAADNPDMPMELLEERLGVDRTHIAKIIGGVSVERKWVIGQIESRKAKAPGSEFSLGWRRRAG